MKILRYEKIGDISETYPFLEIYNDGVNEPFMEVSITDDKELNFRFYNKKPIELSLENWIEILKIAEEFLPKALKDEEDYERFMKSDNSDL